MAPDASHDDVKRAYLEHALRFRPDRRGDLSPDDRERAEFRLQEINAAWAVLRSPAARAHYDDELRSAEPGVSSARQERAGAGNLPPIRLREAPPEQEVADLAPAGEGEDDDDDDLGARRARRWWKYAPVIVGGVVVGVILVVTAIATRVDNSALKVDTVEQFGNGTCVEIVSDPSLGTPVAGAEDRKAARTVPCGLPNDGRIIGRATFPQPCPDGSRALVLVEAKESLCLVKK